MDILLERMLSLIPRKPDGKYVHGAKKVFCENIGAPTNIISEWETGKTKSYRNYVHAAAMAYNVSVEWLRGETEQKKIASPKGSEFLEKYSLLTPQNQALIDQMLDQLSKAQSVE